MSTLFEQSQDEQSSHSLPYQDAAFDRFIPEIERNSPLPLPFVAEIDLIRHFTNLSRKNVGIDTTFYPLGSCTMKLNPKVNDEAASLPEFQKAHPLADDDSVQGCLQIMYELVAMLCQIVGMDDGTLSPAAGAQGEFVGLRMIQEFHKDSGQERDEVLIPDSAHGTNPASATLAGFKTISIPSGPDGDIDLAILRQKLSSKTAALMLTNPTTLGLFSKNILEVTDLVHSRGGLLYYDGANLNPILNVVRPGDMGFDVLHLNLHKTFSTPHGGGGPGSGPVLCKARLKDYLPFPKVIKTESGFKRIFTNKKSIGSITSFQGNFGVYLRAYLYIKLLGDLGLRKVAETSVLNANYIKQKLRSKLKIPFKGPCMHEFVIQCDEFNAHGIKAGDIAKRLLDFGFYSPTVYFPLSIKESMLIEPTETESKKTLDAFIDAFFLIIEEILHHPEIVKTTPHTTSVGRLDEVWAARNPILSAIKKTH